MMEMEKMKIMKMDLITMLDQTNRILRDLRANLTLSIHQVTQEVLMDNLEMEMFQLSLNKEELQFHRTSNQDQMLILTWDHQMVTLNRDSILLRVDQEDLCNQTWDQVDQEDQLLTNRDNILHRAVTSTTNMDILHRDNQEDHQDQEGHRVIHLTEDHHREDLRDNSSDQDQDPIQVDQEVMFREVIQIQPELDPRTKLIHTTTVKDTLTRTPEEEDHHRDHQVWEDHQGQEDLIHHRTTDQDQTLRQDTTNNGIHNNREELQDIHHRDHHQVIHKEDIHLKMEDSLHKGQEDQEDKEGQEDHQDQMDRWEDQEFPTTTILRIPTRMLSTQINNSEDTKTQVLTESQDSTQCTRESTEELNSESI